MSDPLTRQELAAARSRAEEAYAAVQAAHPAHDLKAWYWLAFSPWEDVSASYCLLLLDEIDRLRMKDEAITAAIVDLSRQRDSFIAGQTEEHAKVERMRPIVAAVAKHRGQFYVHPARGSDYCVFCAATDDSHHEADCPLGAALALFPPEP